MPIKVKTTANSSRNIAVQISGFLIPDVQVQTKGPFLFCQLDNPKVKMTRLTWTIQEKGGLYLWWDKDRKDLVLPLESRNGINFDGLKAPEDWDGALWASGFKLDEPKGFLVIVEFDK